MSPVTSTSSAVPIAQTAPLLQTEGMQSKTALTGPRVLLRPVRRDDLPRIAEILDEPEVARWWGHFDVDELLGPEAEAEGLVIETDGHVIGFIQYDEETDPDYRHAGIDLFLSEERHGEGLGPEAITLLARHLFDELGHHRIVIDPAASNERAVRAYEKAGFRRVGLMRRYERGADGTWHDALLLELLEEDLS